MKYIDDDKKNGIEYDYKKIAKEYKKIVKVLYIFDIF